MKHSTLLSTILVSSSILAFADPLPEPAPKITSATTGFNLDWDGTNGNTYFIEYSSDLVTWQFMPDIKSGIGGPLGYGFNAPDNRLFFRLKYTDVATSNALTDDFDNDGVSNWDEVRIGGSGTNPFLWDSSGDGKSDYFSDRDSNGLADGWELKHYAGIGVANPSGNDDDDSLSNLEESLMGSDPLLADTDADGKDDDEESIWWDDRIKWPRSPESHYVVIELTGYTPAPLNYGNIWDINSIYSGGYVDGWSLQVSMNSSPKNNWEIQALSNSGHVLVGEDKRNPAGDVDFTLTNAASIPNSIKNWLWDPATSTWTELANNSSSEGQTLLAAATDVSKTGDIVGFAWVPLAWANGDAAAWPGMEKVEAKWLTKDSPSVTLLRGVYADNTASDFVEFVDEETPYHNLIELPDTIISPSISDEGKMLTYEMDPYQGNGIAQFKIGGTLIDSYDYGVMQDGLSPYMTRTGEVFYRDSSTEDIFVRLSDTAGTKQLVADGTEKPSEIQNAVKTTHTTNDSDILALSPALWMRDSGTWKKVIEHPSKTFISGKGISSDGVILGWAGNSITTNGKTVPIKDLVSSTGWSDFKMAKMNDGGMMAGRATKDGVEKIVLILPVDIVQGIPGSEAETTDSSLIAEVDPKPTVEMSVVDSEIDGTDLLVHVTGTVKDALSEYGTPISELTFTVFGETVDTLQLSGDVATGEVFDQVITIPNVKSSGYVLKAKTSTNHVGNTGWDKVGVGVSYVEDETHYPEDKTEFSIAFDQDPSASVADTASIYFGVRNPTSNDEDVTETTASSLAFTGNVNMVINEQEEQVPCEIKIIELPTFSPTEKDTFNANITLTLPNLGFNQIITKFEETELGSRVFRPTGYVYGDRVLEAGGLINLPGSQSPDLEPITLRVYGPDSWEDNDDYGIKVGETFYKFKKFTYNGVPALYAYDESNAGNPRLFLPSSKTIPSSLSIPNYDAETNELAFKLIIGGEEASSIDITVVDGPEEVIATPQPLAMAAPAPMAATASTAWQKGEPIEWEDLKTAYLLLYGDNHFAKELFYSFFRGGHILEMGDILGDLDTDVQLNDIFTDTDNIWTIQIEEDLDTPIHAAILMFQGLSQLTVESVISNNYDFDNDLSEIAAFKAAMSETSRWGRETTAVAAELYLSGITIFSEPLDWVLVFNDVAEGHPEALVAALPFVSVGMVKGGGKLLLKNAAGDVLHTIDGPLANALKEAQSKADLEEAWDILAEAGGDARLGYLLVAGDYFPIPKSRRKLSREMKKAPNDFPIPDELVGKSIHAHHLFPWKFVKKFAAHGIDVNKPGYGQWAQANLHLGWTSKYEGRWDNFFDAEDMDSPYTIDEIFDFMNGPTMNGGDEFPFWD